MLLLPSLLTRVALTPQLYTPLATSDYILASLALIVLGLELTSDSLQFTFQTYKHAFLAAEKGKITVEPCDAQKQWLGACLDHKPGVSIGGLLLRASRATHETPTSHMRSHSSQWIITVMLLLSPSPPNLSHACIGILPLFKTLENFPHALVPFLQHLLAPLIYVDPVLVFLFSRIYTESVTMSKYPEEYEAYQEYRSVRRLNEGGV